MLRLGIEGREGRIRIVGGGEVLVGNVVLRKRSSDVRSLGVAGNETLTGNKGNQKFYRTHSGWVGGLKETPYRILMQDKPELAMRVAVRGMMPKNSLSRNSLSRLHIYADANFEQQAQKPEAYVVD